MLNLRILSQLLLLVFCFISCHLHTAEKSKYSGTHIDIDILSDVALVTLDTHHHYNTKPTPTEPSPTEPSPKAIHLPGSVKHIQIIYHCSCSHDTALVHYSYRLQSSTYDLLGNLWPVNEDRLSTGNRNHILYRGLEAGKYQLTIAYGPGKKEIFTFFIQRTFTATPWFYLLLFVLGLMVAAAAIFARKRWDGEKVMLPIWSDEGRYKTFKLSNRQSGRHLKKLLQLMDREKPYLDSEITLQALAEKIDINKEALSQVINRELHLNFNAFINKYRIEEAKRKLKDPKENQYVILKIALDVGFSSKSSFNAVFRNIAGMSPSEYRKQYQKE